MRVLVTGGAGFIGRWLVARLLEDGHRVVVVDDYSNGAPENLADFLGRPGLEAVVEADLRAPGVVERIFSVDYDAVYHLAASIRVQDSIDDPRTTFTNDVSVTFELLEAARRQYLRSNGLRPGEPFHLDEVRARLVHRSPRFVFVSTCMVYDRATGDRAIDEAHPTRPASPYGASKIAAENLVLSYGLAYGLPVVVARPFNTYGPFQKSNLEGGVVGIFLANALAGRTLQVKGDGTQTRDLLYVEDCAAFLAALGASALEGEIVNASTGEDVSINALAALAVEVTGSAVPVVHVRHDHPQAEIQKLVGASDKARAALGWSPRYSLRAGLERTRDWLATRR
ncbi:MAG: dTDP-glucose 4,6-dehydratase [Bradymonadia bacterium]|jgi:nucleoside-diphosphate-sugar epimerase